MTATTFKSSSTTAAVKITPINLRDRFGKKYRVTYEESYCAQYGERARIDDPWLQVIEGRLGHIYPFDGELLAASTAARGPLAKRLASLPFCRVWQDGDDGITVLFPAEQFKVIAKLLRVRVKRGLSLAQRKALAEGGASHRYRGITLPEVQGTNAESPTTSGAAA
jgi:hypothetical protein